MNEITVRLLKMAAEKFSNDGCNDLPDGFWDGASEDVISEVIELVEEELGEPRGSMDINIENIGNDTLMLAMARKLGQNQ